MRYIQDIIIEKAIMHVLDINGDGSVDYIIKNVRNVSEV